MSRRRPLGHDPLRVVARSFRLLVPVLLVLAPSTVRAAVCTLSGVGNWGPIDTWTGVDDCGGVLTPADDFLIVGSATVVDDLTQDSGAIGLTVAEGATLQATVSDTTDSLRIVLGDKGFTGNGTTRLIGKFRQWGVGGPSLQADPDPWPVGKLVFCPDVSGKSDCNAGNRHIIRLVYPDAQYGDDPEGQHSNASIVELVPGEDVICFWDFNLTDDDVPVDANYCYLIEATNAGPNPYIDVNVEQGVLNQYGYPLDRRHLLETTVTSGFDITAFNPYAGLETAGVELGQRAICIDESTASAVEKLTAVRPIPMPQDGIGDGYWLRFTDAGGEPLTDSYQIVRVDTAGDNGSPCGAGHALVVILDIRGFGEPHLAGSTVFIDYGWRTGETFFTMAPVYVTSASPLDNDTKIAVTPTGGIELFAAHMAATNRINIITENIPRWKHVWVQDIYTRSTRGITFEMPDRGTITIGHTTVTGGSDISDPGCSGPINGCDDVHVIQGCNLGTNQISDLAVRHAGDDILTGERWCPSGNGAPGVNYVANRIRAQFRSDSMDTGEFWSQFGGAGETILTDGQCVDCAQAVLQTPAADHSGLFNALFAMSMDGGFSNASQQLVRCDDCMFVGSSYDDNGAMMTKQSDGFVVREVNGRGSRFSYGLKAFDLRNGFVVDTRNTGSSVLLASDGIVENLAIINATMGLACSGGAKDGLPCHEDADCGAGTCEGDHQCTNDADGCDGSIPKDTCAVIRAKNPNGGTFTNITVAYRDGVTPTELDVAFQQSLGSENTWDKVLIANFQGDDDNDCAMEELEPWFDQNQTYRDFCFVDNVLDFNAQDPPPIQTLTGECGATQSPGIREFQWFHALSRIEPEYLHESECADGLDNDWDGDTNCDDTDCQGIAGCPEIVCDDQIDNDSNDTTDCLDASCNGVGACEFAMELTCDDLLDNDGSGDTDCADPGCIGTSPCELPAELTCNDGFDNDGDGNIDCSDSDCAGGSPCELPSELSCDDALDNDADGDLDCDDTDCQGIANCPEIECTDMGDNDADGDSDCADSDCASSSPCELPSELSCDDALDNDADGDVDCLDSDCTAVGQCPAVPSMGTPGLALLIAVLIASVLPLFAQRPRRSFG